MTLSKWDVRYAQLAKHISTWSKDPSRQIGAVAVGSKGEILAQGFNGLPRGILDKPERLNDRPTKYKYVVHAEMNVIYNASLNGISLNGSSLYVYGLPVCSECAKGIIQVGIKKVYIMMDGSIPEQWVESWAQTKSMFEEAGVEFEWMCRNKIIYQD